MKKIFESEKIKKTALALGIAVIALLIFQAGLFVGYRKAGFSYRFGENYYRAFGGERRSMMNGMMMKGTLRDGLMNAHGAVGKIVNVNLPTFVLLGNEGVEKVIRIGGDTEIRKFRDTLKASDLKVGDTTVILGSPNANSEIEAKLIRVLPAQNTATTSSVKK